MSDTPFSSQPVHIAKFLQLDRGVQNLHETVQKLVEQNKDIQKQLRELSRNGESYVSHAELLAALTGRKPAKTVEPVVREVNNGLSLEKVGEIIRSIESLKTQLSKVDEQTQYSSVQGVKTRNDVAALNRKVSLVSERLAQVDDNYSEFLKAQQQQELLQQQQQLSMLQKEMGKSGDPIILMTADSIPHAGLLATTDHNTDNYHNNNEEEETAEDEHSEDNERHQTMKQDVVQVMTAAVSNSSKMSNKHLTSGGSKSKESNTSVGSGVSSTASKDKVSNSQYTASANVVVPRAPAGEKPLSGSSGGRPKVLSESDYLNSMLADQKQQNQASMLNGAGQPHIPHAATVQAHSNAVEHTLQSSPSTVQSQQHQQEHFSYQQQSKLQLQSEPPMSLTQAYSEQGSGVIAGYAGLVFPTAVNAGGNTAGECTGADGSSGSLHQQQTTALAPTYPLQYQQQFDHSHNQQHQQQHQQQQQQQIVDHPTDNSQFMTQAQVMQLLSPLYGAINGHASRQDIDMTRVAKVYDSLIVLDKEHTALLKAHKELNEKHLASEATIFNLVGQLMNVIDTSQANVERHERWSVLQSRQLQYLADCLNIKLEEMSLEELRNQTRGQQQQQGGGSMGATGYSEASAVASSGPSSYEKLLSQYAVQVEKRVVANPENEGYAALPTRVPEQPDLDLVLSNPVEPTNSHHGKMVGHVPPKERNSLVNGAGSTRPPSHAASTKASRSASPSAPTGRVSGTVTPAVTSGAATGVASMGAGNSAAGSVSVNIKLPAATVDYSGFEQEDIPVYPHSSKKETGGEGDGCTGNNSGDGDGLSIPFLPSSSTELGDRVNAMMLTHTNALGATAPPSRGDNRGVYLGTGAEGAGSGAVLQVLVQQIAGYKEHFAQMVSDYNQLAAEHKTMMILNGSGSGRSATVSSSTTGAAPPALPASVNGIGLTDDELKKNGKTFVNKQQLHCIFQQKDEVTGAQIRDLKAQIEKLRQLVTYNRKAIAENNPSYQLDELSPSQPETHGHNNYGRASTASGSGIRQSTSPTLPRTTLISSASGRRKPPKSASGLVSRSQESAATGVGVGFDLGGARERPLSKSRGRKFALPPGSKQSSRQQVQAQAQAQAALESRLIDDLADDTRQYQQALVRPNPPAMSAKPSSMHSSQLVSQVQSSLFSASQAISHAQYSASVEVPSTEVIIQPPRRPEAVAAGLEYSMGLKMNSSEVGNSQSRRRSKANDHLGDPLMDQQSYSQMQYSSSAALTDSDSAVISTTHGNMLSSSLYSSVSAVAAVAAAIHNDQGQDDKSKGRNEPRKLVIGKYVPADAAITATNTSGSSVPKAVNIMQAVLPEQLWNSEYTGAAVTTGGVSTGTATKAEHGHSHGHSHGHGHGHGHSRVSRSAEENPPPSGRANKNSKQQRDTENVGMIVPGTGIGESFIEEMESRSAAADSSVGAQRGQGQQSVVSELSEGSMLSEYFRIQSGDGGDHHSNGGHQNKVSKANKLKILQEQGRLLDRSAGSKY